MKSTTFALGSLLAASFAVAQPHHKHQAFHHQKRDPAVVWVTDWDIVTDVVDVTTTIWVSEGYVAPSSSAQSSPSSVSASSVTDVPAQFFEPAPSTPPAPTTFSTSSVSVAAPPPAPTPSTSSVVAPPAPAPEAPAPEVESSSTPVASSTPAAAPSVAPAPAPEPSTSAPAPVASSTPSSGGSSSGSSSGQCSDSSSPCSGDITYYAAGLGACGWDNDSETDNIVALSHLLMGEQSNGNPFCGKTITVEYMGKTTTAKVVDKCMGCDELSIDLSNKAFEDLADLSIGRATANWYFN
jgi:hypothetical protein